MYSWLWPFRACLQNRKDFSKRSYLECGRPYWEYHQIPVERNRTPLTLAFAEVATHNHFVLDRGGKVFKQTAPVIKLPTKATVEEYLALLGLLNSSTACFWMKQVCFPKGTATGDISSDKGRAEANRYAFSSTAIGNCPIPDLSTHQPQLIALSRKVCEQAEVLTRAMPDSILNQWESDGLAGGELLGRLTAGEMLAEQAKNRMVYLQEEIDWLCYQAYGLVARDTGWKPSETAIITPNTRPFCWAGLEGASEVPDSIRSRYAERRACIEQNPAVRLIESAMYKRPWLGRQGVYGSASRSYAEKTSDAVRTWLLCRLESYFELDGRMNDQGIPTAQIEVSLISTAKLADLAGRDPAFQVVAELYRGRPDFDVTKLVCELVEGESVPPLPVLRYKPSGMDKRSAWERTWDLQRREDAIDARATREGVGVNDGDWTAATDDGSSPLTKAQAELLKKHAVGAIPVPPKYKSADFLKGDYWRLRGGLDVPKERWVIFPHCEGADGQPLVAWAGYDHLQLAKAVAAHYVRVQEQEGGRDDPRLVPLLACLAELLPWLKQWHNGYDAEYGVAMGDYYEGFVQDEARQMGRTVEQVRAWQPPAAGRRQRRAARSEPAE